MTTSPTLILYPLFALFLLTMWVLFYLGSLRLNAIRTRQVSIKFFRTYAGNDEPERSRVVSRHFINLLEMPVLFYVGVILVYVTARVTSMAIVCAWSYVALRYLHSYVHLTSNNVKTRFFLYLASTLPLLLLWIDLFVKLVRGS